MNILSRGHGILAGLLVACAVGLSATRVPAQVLQGKWVDQTEQRIAKHRMADVRLIVLQADGTPAAHAKVHLELRRHLFDVGVTWPQDGVPVDDDRAAQPVWRVLNATSLESLTAWAATHPTAEGDAAQQQRIDEAIDWSRKRGWTVRWGPLLLADPGRLPGWVRRVDPADMPSVIEQHVVDTLHRYGGRVSQFDLYAGGTDHHYFDEQYGPALLRKLKEQASAIAPASQLSLRYDDALLGARMSQMRQKVVAREEQLVPFDTLAVDGSVRGFLASATMADVMTWFGRMGRSVVLSKVEVGGPSLSAAAVNMETLVRLAFAEPSVQGIYFAGMRADDLSDPTAALLDDDGHATPAGRVLDELFRTYWQTPSEVACDAMGNARQRVFAGVYHITATLEDGSTAALDVRIEPGDVADERLVIIQPLRH